jgi:hypothetical protein
VKSPIIGRWFSAAVLVASAVASCTSASYRPASQLDRPPLSLRAETPTVSPAPVSASLAVTAAATALPAALVTATPVVPWPAQIVQSCGRGSDQPGIVCGVYAAGVLALRVVQQPAGDPAFIATESGTATQFQKVDQSGAVGLLAHNTLAGRDFYKLAPGQELVLIYGDGHIARFHVSQIADFQRLTLADLRSDFLSLATNQHLTADQIFAQFYQQPHRLTLQTCLQHGGVTDWGVHFVVADLN